MKKIILGGLFFRHFTLISCEKHPAFKTSIEAIEACKKELDNLSSKTSVDTKELVKLTNEWIEIRDSSYSVFAKDTTMLLKVISRTLILCFLIPSEKSWKRWPFLKIEL